LKSLTSRVPDFITIALVIAPWGLRGEVKLHLETDFPERFHRLKTVYLGPKREPFEFDGFRQHGAHYLLKLKGCDNPETARNLNGLEVQIPGDEAMPLPPGRFYEYQIEGLTVSTEEGERLGVLDEVLFTGGNSVYVVRGAKGEVLIPVLPDVVMHVDVEAGQMIVRLPPGLVD
jgi:16S rRNA processing protein RimM